MNKQETLVQLHLGKTVVSRNGVRFRYDSEDGMLIFDGVKSTHWSLCPSGLGEEPFELHTAKKKVKLWQFVDGNGNITRQFYVEKAVLYWDGTQLRASNRCTKSWIKTNCFIEVEVEVEDE